MQMQFMQQCAPDQRHGTRLQRINMHNLTFSKVLGKCPEENTGSKAICCRSMRIRERQVAFFHDRGQLVILDGVFREGLPGKLPRIIDLLTGLQIKAVSIQEF